MEMEKLAELTQGEQPESNIGGLLVEAGKIKPEDRERITRIQREQNLRFGEAAIKLGLVNEGDIREALAQQFDYAYLAPGKNGFSPELAAAYQPFSAEVEALRTLRTQLKLRWFNGRRKHLALIGALPGAGCSYHAANLAVVFSQLGERTLLIDANLRDPRQALIFNLGNRQGLTEILSDRVNQIPLVRIPALGNLSVLPAGAVPPNPGELLSRGSLPKFLTQLDKNFDIILIDTPPAMSCTDAQTIAFQAGSALIVARMDHTRLSDISAINDSLATTSTEVAGVVLSKF
jgi:chain length determinant protein tyrosine kinase EpsG